MALKAYCDYCDKEIEDQEKGIVDIRMHSWETPLSIHQTAGKSQKVESSRIILFCQSCKEQFLLWLEKKPSSRA